MTPLEFVAASSLRSCRAAARGGSTPERVDSDCAAGHLRIPCAAFPAWVGQQVDVFIKATAAASRQRTIAGR